MKSQHLVRVSLYLLWEKTKGKSYPADKNRILGYRVVETSVKPLSQPIEVAEVATEDVAAALVLTNAIERHKFCTTLK